MKAIAINTYDLYRYLLTIGSNLGTRERYLSRAIEELIKNEIKLINKSTIYNNSAQLNATHDFLNQSILIETKIRPTELMSLLQEIEDHLGRDRSVYKGDRTIDLDISYAQLRVKNASHWQNIAFKDINVEIPHPLAHKRDFVLLTASEVAPEWVDPINNKTIKELLNCL